MRSLFALGLCVAGVLLPGAEFCHAGDASELRHNPFSRPVSTESNVKSAPSSGVVQPPELWKLRGIMLAGAASLVNIDGNILGLGEELEGYRIVSIEARQVTVTKNNQRKVLSFDEEPGEIQNE